LRSFSFRRPVGQGKTEGRWGEEIAKGPPKSERRWYRQPHSRDPERAGGQVGGERARTQRHRDGGGRGDREGHRTQKEERTQIHRDGDRGRGRDRHSDPEKEDESLERGGQGWAGEREKMTAL
jgi:hypothetical protein